MNSIDFTNIIKQPKKITHEQTDELKYVIDEFPYFQSARAIYLKGLKNRESYKYNQALKTTAAYTTDRSILFDFITSEEFIQNEISQLITQNTLELKDHDTPTLKEGYADIENTSKLEIEDTTAILNPDFFEPKKDNKTKESDFILDKPEMKDVSTRKNENQNITTSKDTDILNLGKPLIFDKKETHSFNEWLKLTKLNPIEREELNKSKLEQQQEKEEKFRLIEDFISKNPKINPIKNTANMTNIAKAQMIKPESLMTETLARIYVEQKNYKKAIQSYKILSLKYPKKSVFFADQIKAIELLQEQNNK